MSLHRKHFTDLADLIVHIKTHEFETDQDLISFVKVEIVRFCYDHGVNFNRNTFESYISNHVQKAIKEKKENGLIKLSDTISHLIPNQS
tara:strand:+ start:678 stop:944 length:267 start_codon:yes stop_codon:yes gene_type:complete